MNELGRVNSKTSYYSNVKQPSTGLTQHQRDLRALRAGTLVASILWLFICMFDQSCRSLCKNARLGPINGCVFLVVFGWYLMFILFRTASLRWQIMTQGQRTLTGFLFTVAIALLFAWLMVASTVTS